MLDLRPTLRAEGMLPFAQGGFNEHLRHALAQGRRLELLYFAVKDFFLFEDLYGPELVADIDDILQRSLIRKAREALPGSEPGAVSLSPGRLALFWCGDDRRPEMVPELAFALKLTAEEDLSGLALPRIGRRIELTVGYAECAAGPGDDPERAMLRAVSQARHSAQQNLDAGRLKISRAFNDLLLQRSLSMHYQPIVGLSSSTIMGWEALARPPADSPFASPLVLFNLAETLGRLFDLEKLCREAAIRDFGPCSPGQKLFLNIHPRTIVDPGFTAGATMALLDGTGLRPENVVFEITERHSVKDFRLFHQTLDHYRSQGFKVAVDDVGSGYSGLTSIAEIRPDYLKLDKGFTGDIDRNPVKRALIETFVSFADKIGSKIIAEGIETRSQALCLLDIGVHFGQGWLFARPAHPKPGLAEGLSSLRPIGQTALKTSGCSISVGGLAAPAQTASPDTPAEEVHTFFERRGPLSSVVVTDADGVPQGLIMDYHLNRHLSGKYGLALYAKRPVSLLMDAVPLAVDAAVPVEQAARKAMARDRLKTYDDVIVTRRGRLAGTVSVQKLLETLAQVQVDMAKGVNPLTGLPGNVEIEREIAGRLDSGRSMSLIYADLDNFKVYNDAYGFKNGDDILLLFSRILAFASRRHGGADDFVGHIGGDDFVCITDPSRCERVCQAVTRIFGRLVRSCYCEEDRRRGYIKGKGRDGREALFPLVSVSLGIVDCEGVCDLYRIGERAAEMKKYAKSVAGNSWVRDRRNLMEDGTGEAACPAPRRREAD